jgi:transcriptional regulator with XRE-family HTH domain
VYVPADVPESGESAQFARFLNSLLESHHLSGAQAARRLGVSQSQVSRWRRGEGGISLENLERIHAVFGVELAYLKQLAGLRSSHPTVTLDDIEAERQKYRAWYQHLLEVKVPRSMWAAYSAACDALADVFRQSQAGELSTHNQGALNGHGSNTDEGPEGASGGKLTANLPHAKGTYHSVTLSSATAH